MGLIYNMSCPKIDHKSAVSSPVVILYDLSYNYHNYVLTLSYGNPEINLIVR